MISHLLEIENAPDCTHSSVATGDRLDRLIAQAQRVRVTIGTKRSDKLLRLFDFLLTRTIEGRPPTEMEIADHAFSIGKVIDGPQDATVRVYVHRLRKAIDLFYADNSGPRLFIPKGDYALVLVEEGDDPPVAIRPPQDKQSKNTVEPGWKKALLCVALVLALNAVALWVLVPRPTDGHSSMLARTALWGPILTDNKPITVVLGDYYLFAETAGPERGASTPDRLIRDPSINAREDLDVYLMARPEEMGKLKDIDTRYLSASTVISLGGVFDVLRASQSDPARRISVIPASQLTADTLKSSNVVYIGLLNGLGSLLRNSLFQASAFKVGSTYDELIDGPSGRHFLSDGGLITPDERMARRDFGYMARLPGPSGNHIVILAGVRDAALRQMVEFAGNSNKLAKTVAKESAEREGFEALYQVRTMGNLNISGQLLITRPLRSQGIWDRSTPIQRFPNDNFEGEGHAKP